MNLWQDSQHKIMAWMKEIAGSLTRDPNGVDVFTNASWCRHLDVHPFPRLPVSFDGLAAPGPWEWWESGA